MSWPKKFFGENEKLNSAQTAQTQENILPDGVLNLSNKDVNCNVNGEIVNILDLEKIYFLYKLNPEPDFIAMVTGINTARIEHLISTRNFQEITTEYLSEYVLHDAGETVEELTYRYATFLKECFTAVRISIGLKIRANIHAGKPIDNKALGIAIIERLMKMEFSLRGIPINLKAIYHKSDGKDSHNKTNEELLDGVYEIRDLVESIPTASFSPGEYKAKELDAMGTGENEEGAKAAQGPPLIPPPSPDNDSTKETEAKGEEN